MQRLDNQREEIVMDNDKDKKEIEMPNPSPKPTLPDLKDRVLSSQKKKDGQKEKKQSQPAEM